MNKPRKKLRVIGERRAQLDVARFADALIALALHRLSAAIEADAATPSGARVDQERPS
ncbi:hypothetical protein GTY75_03810 [Streptomyces sp. SID8381]|uniref:hypothetical protein n=1 Tax=Streptomyces sp. Amel2xE9 TaxID=1157634 RepID=UPI001319E18E|nr:hypothetical protein [Streptomyces sp. Amel2xE9]MYX25803.1 hypothetical protein [Streptomyces sp. SID8381]